MIIEKSITYIFGMLAAALSTISILPQNYKTYKTKQAHDISSITVLFYVASNIIWLIYGMLMEDQILWCASFITATSWGMLLMQKLYYRVKA